MLRPVHHGTVRKARDVGVILRLDDDGARYVAVWPRRKLKFWGRNAVDLCEDAVLYERQISTLSRVKVYQDDAGEWMVDLDGDRLTSSRRLTLAWNWVRGAGLLDGLKPPRRKKKKGEGRSIVDPEYQAEYRKRQGFTDQVAELLARYTSRIDALGRRRTDLAKLRALAEVNECWLERYRALNAGQQRMNVGNRLRARIRKGHRIVWETQS